MYGLFFSLFKPSPTLKYVIANEGYLVAYNFAYYLMPSPLLHNSSNASCLANLFAISLLHALLLPCMLYSLTTPLKLSHLDNYITITLYLAI